MRRSTVRQRPTPRPLAAADWRRRRATIVVMGPTVEDALKALREATELAREIRIELTDEYLRHIAVVEALPENQPGARKSSRWLGSPRYWDSLRRGRFASRRP